MNTDLIRAAKEKNLCRVVYLLIKDKKGDIDLSNQLIPALGIAMEVYDEHIVTVLNDYVINKSKKDLRKWIH